MNIKNVTTEGELNYVISSFCKSYSKNKIGKHLYSIYFVLQAFLKISKMTDITMIKEGNIIKAWVLHTDRNILYACGSIKYINILEKDLDIYIEDSISMFYMNKAKGWVGFESRF